MLVLTALVAAGCAGGPPAGPPVGSLAAAADLRGQTYDVGGKAFDEQRVLCQIEIAALQAAGAVANDRCGIQGSNAVRGALLSGQIDTYWEYTGTAWSTYLNEPTPIPDARGQYEAVRQADAANGVTWLSPTPFDDTYAIVTRPDTAAALRIRTLSDFAQVANGGSPAPTLCVDSTFADRDDGLRHMLATYGITRAYEGPPALTTDAEAVHQDVAFGTPCRFGEVLADDSRRVAFGLTPVVDDRNAFPPYNASPVFRTDVFNRDPTVARVLDTVSARLTDEVMLDLNRQVALEGRDPSQVARTWLVQQGLIESS